MLKKFASYYKPHIKLFLLDMICALLVAVCNLIYPKVAGQITTVKSLNFVLIWGGVLLGIFIIKAVLNYIIAYWGHVVGVRIQADMRRDMFKHLQTLPFSYYDETRTGSVMSRLVNDLFEISELAHHGPENIIISSISIIAAFIYLMTINVYLTLIIFACVPVLILISFSVRKKMRSAFMESRKAG